MIRLFRIAGATDAARAEAAVQIDRVLRKGLSLGLFDAGLLDYFYADERLRRFGTTGERRGVISPLLTPAFVQAGFGLRPQQRLDAELHRGVLEHLVPRWADVPFFKPTPGAPAASPVHATPEPPPSPFRLGLATDADRFCTVFDLPSRYAADIDPRVVGDLWTASRAGRSTPAEELALWRVVWADLFHDYLAETLGGSADPREAVSALPSTSGAQVQPHRPTTKVSSGAVEGSPRRRVIRLIRWAGRTPLGRTMRRSRLAGRLSDQVRRRGLMRD